MLDEKKEQSKKLRGYQTGLVACVIIIVVLGGVFYSTYQNQLNQINTLKENKDALQNQVNTLSSKKEKLESDLQDLQSTYANLSQQYETLNRTCYSLTSNYTSLYSIYSSLNSSYYLLSSNYLQLNVTYHDLTDNYTSLNTQYSELSSNHTNLSQNYSQLQTDFNSLNNKYLNLNSSYWTLSGEYTTYQQNYTKMQEQINLHQILNPKLITPDDPAVISKVQDITGGWSNHSDWNEYWSDIKSLYDWIHDNIEYRYDGFYPYLPSNPSWGVVFWTEMFQFPNQTLNELKGDCDDKAILLCSMIRCYATKQYMAECMVVTGHLLCYIPVAGDNICILDPTMGYYTNTGFPFYGITAKDVANEINNYLSWSGTGRVWSVFSDYLELEIFSNTQEFIDWMKDRI